MISPSAAHVNRIVAIVAELSLRERQGLGPAKLAELAERYAVSPARIEQDLRDLTELGMSAAADWLLSLNLWQEGDSVGGRSGGPYRRPIRFTSDELVALRIGLALDGDEHGSEPHGDLSRRIAALAGDDPGGAPGPARSEIDRLQDVAIAVGPASVAGDVPDLLLRAIAARRIVSILYASPSTREPAARRVQPHRLVEAPGSLYLVAWCESAEDWRRFRVDRILEASLQEETFEPRHSVEVDENSRSVFKDPEDGVEEVVVRFSPRIGRWLEERYPEAVVEPDGSVVVTYRVASPEWLIRHVLQYGPDAEVLSPEPYREAMRRAVTA